MRFLGDGWDWDFFLAAARAPDMRASKAEGGLDMVRRERERGEEKRERQKGGGKQCENEQLPGKMIQMAGTIIFGTFFSHVLSTTNNSNHSLLHHI